MRASQRRMSVGSPLRLHALFRPRPAGREQREVQAAQVVRLGSDQGEQSEKYEIGQRRSAGRTASAAARRSPANQNTIKTGPTTTSWLGMKPMEAPKVEFSL